MHFRHRLRLDEPWHGNVLLSCGPHKLEPNQQLQEFNADFVPRLWSHKFRSYGRCACELVTSFEQSFFLQVKIYMKVDLHMVGCRQFAGVRRLA